MQVISDSRLVRMKDDQPLEAVITSGIAHANIVRTLAYSWYVQRRTRPVNDGGGSDSGLTISAIHSGEESTSNLAEDEVRNCAQALLSMHMGGVQLSVNEHIHQLDSCAIAIMAASVPVTRF